MRRGRDPPCIRADPDSHGPGAIERVFEALAEFEAAFQERVDDQIEVAFGLGRKLKTTAVRASASFPRSAGSTTARTGWLGSAHARKRGIRSGEGADAPLRTAGFLRVTRTGIPGDPAWTGNTGSGVHHGLRRSGRGDGPPHPDPQALSRVPSDRGPAVRVLAGSEAANLQALSSQAASLSSEAIPAGSTSAHPLITRPFMSAGPVCGSASVAS